MLKHFFKLATRNLLRNKGFTLINILGLTFGMATCLLLLAYIAYHWSFDTFHPNAEQIYRVVNDRFQNGKRVQKGTITYPMVGPQMAADFPEIKQATRIMPTWSIILKTAKNEHIIEDQALYVDSNFFQMFEYPLLTSSGGNLMSKANSIIVSETLARKYFGETKNYNKLVGSELKIDRFEEPFVIKGICRDLPKNTLFTDYHLFFSYPSAVRRFGEGVANSWEWSDFYHYVELQPGSDPRALEGKFATFSDRHFRGEEVSGAEEKFYLQPLAKAHLHSSDLEYEIGTTANGNTVWALLIIAVFILIIGWINYVNLATVSTIERSKEVGVRKVIGAGKPQLTGQFFLEALDPANESTVPWSLAR